MRTVFHNCLVAVSAISTMLVAPVVSAGSNIELLEQSARSSKLLPQSIVMSTLNHADSVIAVGERGHIFSWKNDDIWQQHQVPVSVAITDITRLSDGTLIAVGHDSVILTSTDNSNSWRKVFDGNDLLKLRIDSLQHHIQTLKNTIRSTTDDDEREELDYQLEELIFSLEDTQAQQQDGPNKPLLSVVSTSTDKLFATGAYGTLLMSLDKGENWHLVDNRSLNPEQFHLNQVVATENDQLFVVGENGIGLKSDDLGGHWTVMAMPYSGSLFGVVTQPNTSSLVAFGLQGNLLISSDNGNSWQHKKLATSASLLGGVIANERVYLVGHGGLVVDFDIDDFEQRNVRRHSSGAAFASVSLLKNALVLAGQFGITSWSLKE